MTYERYFTDKKIIAVCLSFCVCFYIYYNHSTKLLKVAAAPPLHDTVYLAKIQFKACMNEAAIIFREDIAKFYEQFAICMGAYTAIGEKNMDVVFNGLSGERKVYLPLSPDFPQSECKWLTIGIGGNTRAEKFFKEKYPQCTFYGVDPGNVAGFDEVGKVFPFGVGKKPPWF